MEFFERYKKLFLITGFLLVVCLMGFAIYVTFFKQVTPVTPPGEPGTEIPPGGLPIAGEGEGQIVPELPGGVVLPGEAQPTVISDIAKGGITKITELNDIKTQNPTMGGNGSDLQYYNKETGQFYKIDKNGDIALLTDKIFHNVDEVTWAPSKSKAILEYPDGANIVYNFDTDKQVTLPKHWKDFNFSPDSNQIVMKSMGISEDNRWLAISNDDGSKVIPLEPLGSKDATVYPSWSPNKQSVAMFTEGVDFNKQEVYFVGLNNENFKATTVEGRGFDPLWSPRGNNLLYSVYSSENNYKPNLWIVGAEGDNIGTNRKNINVETWASKCVFANNISVYCAVPESLQEGAGLFTELADATKDNLIEIDTITGQKKLVAIPDGTYNMSNLIISDNGYYLYFTDKVSGHLNQIRLK